MSSNPITGVIAALVLLATPAAAADNIPHKTGRASYASVAPVHQWTGFYGGLNVGYGLAGLSDNLPLAITSLMTGVIGGAQIGYNYQINSLVLGIEADFQASAQNTSFSSTLPVVGNITVGQRIPYFGTTRGRIGYAFVCGCVMAYATAGAAYGAYEPFISVGGVSIQRTFKKAALAAGAGVEWMVSDRWSTKLEALYLDTGNIGSGIALPVLGTVHMRVRDTITRLGLNYHF